MTSRAHSAPRGTYNNVSTSLTRNPLRTTTLCSPDSLVSSALVDDGPIEAETVKALFEEEQNGVVSPPCNVSERRFALRRGESAPIPVVSPRSGLQNYLRSQCRWIGLFPYLTSLGPHMKGLARLQYTDTLAQLEICQ